MDLSTKPVEAQTLEEFMNGPFLQWVSELIFSSIRQLPLSVHSLAYRVFQGFSLNVAKKRLMIIFMSLYSSIF